MPQRRKALGVFFAPGISASKDIDSIFVAFASLAVFSTYCVRGCLNILRNLLMEIQQMVTNPLVYYSYMYYPLL